MNQDRIPFTYLIQFIPTDQYYYGSKTSKGCRPEDLWNTYFTSSKIVKNLIAAYEKDSFRIVDIQIYSSKDDARRWERDVLINANAAQSPIWLNMSNGEVNKISFAVTDEYRQKLSNIAKGKKKSPEAVAKSAASRTGIKRTTEQKIKMSIAINKVKKIGSENKTSKTFIIIYPDGSEHTITGMRQFCIEHGLSPQQMSVIANGKRATPHRGFLCKHIKEGTVHGE